MEEEIIIIEEPEQVVEIIDAEAESEKAVVVTPESEIKRFESELAAVDTRITAIEDFNDGITFDLIEDSAIDREKRIPTDAKMAKVKKIGGMSRKGINLFDFSKPADTLVGITSVNFSDDTLAVVGNDTSTFSRANWSCYDLIRGLRGKSVTFKADSFAWSNQDAKPSVQLNIYVDGVISYNSVMNQQYITGRTIQIPEGNITDAIIGIYPNNANTRLENTVTLVRPMFLLDDNKDKPYEPYADGLVTANVESVKLVGKNLFNWAKWSGIACNNDGIAVYNDANRSMAITAQNNADAYTRFDAGNFGMWLKAKPNTKYTISWKPTATATGKAFLFENGTTANMISAFNNVGKATLTTTDSAEFLTIRVGAQNAGTTVKWENIQVEEGDTATDYEEFKAEKTIELSTRLKEIELYGISEDVHDYIDLEKKILVRMCRINGEIVEPLASPIVSDISYIIDDEPIAQPFNCKDGYISFEQAQAIKLDIPNTIDFYVKGASPKVIADFKITEETGSIEVKLDDNYKRLIVLLNDDKAVTFATSYNLYFGYANAKRDRSSSSFLGMSLQSGTRVFSATIDKYGDLYSMISSHTTDVNYAQTGVFVTRTKTDTSVFMEKGSYFNINGNWDKSKLFPAGMSVKILGVK